MTLLTYKFSIIYIINNCVETQEVRIVYAKKAPKKLVFRSIFSSDFLPASRTGFLNNRMHFMNSIDFHLLRGKSKPWFPNPKTYFAFFWANPKMNRESIKINSHSEWLSQIKFWDSQSEPVFFCGGGGKNLKNVFLTSGFPDKNGTQQMWCMIFLCWWRLNLDLNIKISSSAFYAPENFEVDL